MLRLDRRIEGDLGPARHGAGQVGGALLDHQVAAGVEHPLDQIVGRRRPGLGTLVGDHDLDMSVLVLPAAAD